MWDEAAKWLKKFDEVVLTALDADGYPASVRADSHAYDPAKGELPAAVPDALRVIEGPASLLCHHHDEKLWKLNAIQVKGRLENRDGAWVFVSTAFKAPSKLAMYFFIRGTQTSGQRYLKKRGLDRPSVNWAAVKEIQRRVKAKKG